MATRVLGGTSPQWVKSIGDAGIRVAHIIPYYSDSVRMHKVFEDLLSLSLT